MHDVARLGPEDHARLSRLLTAAIRALPLGLAVIARRVFGTGANTPGIASIIRAAALLGHGGDNADLRAATDALGQAAQVTLVRDLQPVRPPTERPDVAPRSSWVGPLGRSLGVLWTTAELLRAVRSWAELQQAGDTFGGLDRTKPADVMAAYFPCACRAVIADAVCFLRCPREARQGYTATLATKRSTGLIR